MKYESRRVKVACPNCGREGWTEARVPRAWKQGRPIEQPHLICPNEEDDDGTQ